MTRRSWACAYTRRCLVVLSFEAEKLISRANIQGSANRCTGACCATGNDRVHPLVGCTAERGLCGAFNSSIVQRLLTTRKGPGSQKNAQPSAGLDLETIPRAHHDSCIVTLTAPCSRRVVTRRPDLSKNASIGRLSGRTPATNS